MNIIINFQKKVITLPETNIARKTLGLEDEFPFQKASCKMLC